MTTEPPASGSDPAQHSPLVGLLRSMDGVRIAGRHETFDDIDSRLLFRGWTRAAPARSVFMGRGSDAERVSWLQRGLATFGGADRYHVGVGSGRDWLEIRCTAGTAVANLLDVVLSSTTIHNPRLSFVDVCLLAVDRESVLMLRKTREQTEAYIFLDLRERHRARLRAQEEARTRHLQAYRRKLEAVPDLAVHDLAAEERGLPSAGALAAEFEDPFALPDLHHDNEYDREARDRWLRDHLRTTAFAAPRACYFWPGDSGGPWWRLDLPGRDDWASDVVYAIAGHRVADQWSRGLHWHERCLFLSGDASTVMSWQITEHCFHLHIYPTSVLLERARSRVSAHPHI